LIKLIYFTIVAVFFPIYLQFQGKDATTTGSVAIICLFCIYASGLFTKVISFKFLLLVFAFSIIGMVSSSFLPSYDLTMKSIRHLGAFICSMLLFFVVVNYYTHINEPERKERINGLISFTLLMGAIQITIGIILYFYPPIGKPLAIFAPRNVDVLITVSAGAKRLQSIMTGWEEIGEFIAVLSPLVFYRLAKASSKFLPSLYLVLYTIGVILSATRSAIILFILAGLVFVALNRRTIRFHRIILGSYLLGMCISIMVFISSSLLKYWDAAMGRFLEFSSTYTKTGSLTKAIDRDSAWSYGSQVVSNNLTWFGSGMVTPGNFHCLYLTIIYTLGIIGAAIFFGFLVYLLVRLFVSARRAVDSDMKCLVSACIISLGVFLVNEVKYEFNRDFSYQSFIWLLFAIFWLVSHHAMHYRPSPLEGRKTSG
jgi:hypothetical protein